MSKKPIPKREKKQYMTAREVRLILILMAGFAVGAVTTVVWPILFPQAPERVVEVYWTHECACAAPWIESLRKAGYIVRDFEQFELSSKRRALKMPTSLRGCHLAIYLGYFIEGHVFPEALAQLSEQRPNALGLAYVRKAVDAEDELLIFTAKEPPRRWDTPSRNEPGSRIEHQHNSL